MSHKFFFKKKEEQFNYIFKKLFDSCCVVSVISAGLQELGVEIVRRDFKKKYHRHSGKVHLNLNWIRLLSAPNPLMGLEPRKH